MKGKAIRVELGRVDREGFHGWIVTVSRNGLERMRRFAEESHRSPSAAFAAAVRFRNRMVSGAGLAADLRDRGTGIPGISIGRVRTTAGRYFKHYSASVYGADGRRLTLVFSWLKHGKERALELAEKVLREEREEIRRARRQLKKKQGAAKDRKADLTSAVERSKPTEDKNVRRVDHHYFRGYVVAIGRAQARHQKYFGDRVNGGRRAALERALEYRDGLLAELPPPIRIHRRTKNPTGIPGVALVHDRTRSGRVVPRFVAYWHCADGRREKRSFSTLEYGFAGAEAKAVRAREQGIDQLLLDRKAMLLEELEERRRRRKEWRERRPSVPPPF